MVRDFIYFDKEKIISYGSQLLEGISETVTESNERTKSSTNEINTKAGISSEATLGSNSTNLLANLLSKFGNVTFGIDGEMNLNHTGNKMNNQIVTNEKLLNHYQFTLLRDSLIEQQLLINLDKFPAYDWDKNRIRDKIKAGDFIEFSCNSRLFDSNHLRSVVNSFEKLVDLLQQKEIADRVEKLSTEEVAEFITNVQANNIEYGYNVLSSILGEGINPIIYNALLEFIKGISDGDLSTVKTKYYFTHIKQTNNNFRFVAPVNENNFTESKNDIIFKYGYEPEQEWKVLAQVCKITKDKKKNVEGLNRLGNIDFQTIDLLVDSITNQFTDISTEMGLHSSVKYPDISINLIALYR